MSKQNANAEFSALRTRARERRDAMIAQARAEYEETLSQIADLEQRICGRQHPDRAKLTASVENAIPRDTQFTIGDVMRTLEAADPSRVWQKSSVMRHISKLRKLKLVRRVKRHKCGESSVYVRNDGHEKEDKTLRELIAEIVTKPMRTAEVVVAALEAGWKTTMKPGHFRTHVISRLRQCGFEQKSGFWTP